jgi:L,D-peptidoglycan transpeptidase YkuD (ErfK/YbiS/YcfS/YnhG family)
MNIDVYPSHELAVGDKRYRCALGKSGIVQSKREGDNATPVGTFPIRRVLYRADRVNAPETGLPVSAINQEDGWCDAPDDPCYNRPVTLPYAASHEKLWRDDHVYDVVVVLGHNDDPPVPGHGSAIFMHVAREGYAPTEGCVALTLSDLTDVLAQCKPGDTLTVHASG